MKYEDKVGICEHKDSGNSQYLRKQERVETGYQDKIREYGMRDKSPMEFADGTKPTQYRK